MTKKTFPLHQAALEDASDIDLAKTISAVVAELRDRALLSKSYLPLSEQVVKNACRNAAMKAAGL